MITEGVSLQVRKQALIFVDKFYRSFLAGSVL